MESVDEQNSLYPYVEYNNATFPPMPPLVSDAAARFKVIKEFNTKENDILLCSAPKSGTHWVHEIISMLISQRAEYNLEGPFWERYMEFMEDPEELEKDTKQRIYSTHLPLSYLPKKHVDQGYKIVYLNRNPKDRHVSWYNFMQGKNGVPVWSWGNYFEEFVLKDSLFTGWFNFTKEMTDAIRKKAANIFPVLYEDLLLDGKKQVQNLAKFLEVSCADELIDEIVEKCSFNKLKNHKYEVSSILHPEKKSTLFRKGVIGDWKNWFTVLQNEQFDALYEMEMKDCNIHFIYNSPTEQ